ncbi:hypothetical protein Hanom_Chr05g00425841 [Helianthus anomalus]
MKKCKWLSKKLTSCVIVEFFYSWLSLRLVAGNTHNQLLLSSLIIIIKLRF